MNKPVKTLLSVLAFATAGLFAQAQSAPKIMVVDMIKLMDAHYKTQEQKAKLQSDAEKATEQAQLLLKDRNSLIEHYKELLEQSNNPTTKAEVKEQTRAEAEKKLQEIQAKTNDLQNFEANTRNILQQRFQTFKTIILEDIAKIATDVAKSKGATLLIDKSGPNLLGISNTIYADASMDITDEVQSVIDKTRPAASSASATPAPANKAAESGDTPKITVPMGK